ncbi:protein-tyrosine-phosphatase MKP1 [Arachis stenosperma]|uniref:protein-tyrosine-phosphatase MKP1 n=1 Tax=Arachis stenosperma TaxID=217475 RepID=UPI0025AC5B3C|nr:protein-tyrosine-phosphatase MKP1 [Arachis stenosperma]
MVGNDDAGDRRVFWRSASWSSSRTGTASSNNPSGEADPNSCGGDTVTGQNRKFCPPPLTPRSQQSSKSRSSLPPLQPLSIARRSLDEWPQASSDDIGEWLPPQPPLTPGGGMRGNPGERLKLDLSSIQMNNDRNCNNGSNSSGNNNSCNNNGVSGLLKRDRIAFFDKECSKVAEHVYLGGDAVAKNRDILKQNGITHILNCVGFVCPEYFKADFVYRTLWLQDSPSEDITSILYDVFDYFEDVREQGGRVFVHCCQGVSRSTSLVIAYLMWREGQSFDDAFQLVKAARGIADPNMGFACQLLQCQKRVHAVPLSPTSLLRMYRMAPHSPYDPLHLVPKMLTDPSPSALDSRGAFFVHIPTAIFVWIGMKCDSIMERDARGAVGQIIRYEKAEGPVKVIREAQEPADFWEVFSRFLPLMDKSYSKVESFKSSAKVRPGERKVGSYDVDYEVFQKAIVGGFVPPFPSSEDEHETHLPARESSWSALRRKVSSSHMKEIVTAPKSSLPRVYSDSMLCIHSTKTSSPSSSSISSSSPSYISPDSVSSDSNSHLKFLSEVSPDNSAVLTANPVSSSLSKFSNLTLLQSSTSQPVSNSADICDIKLSHPHSHPAPLPLKKPSSSLAERRGSLSKSLQLPLMNDKTEVTDKPLPLHANRQDGVLENGNLSCSQPSDSTYNSCGTNNRVEDTGANSINVDYKDSLPVRKSSELSIYGSSSGYLKPTSSDSLHNGDGSLQCKISQTLVYHWPNLEKIETFGASHLESKAAFVVFSPTFDVNEENILYFWIGRSFSCNASRVQLIRGIESDFVGEFDWNRIGCDVLTRLSLPKNTIVKVVRQNEEPREFHSLLSSL